MKAISWIWLGGGLSLALGVACADDRGDAFGASVLPTEGGTPDTTPALDGPTPDGPDPLPDGHAPVDAAADLSAVDAGASWPTGPLPAPWTIQWIGEPPPPTDAAPPPDAGAPDSEPPDGPPDSEPADAAAPDAEPTDTGEVDSAPADSGEVDAEAEVGARYVVDDDVQPWWAQAHAGDGSLALRAAGKGVDVSAPDDQFLFVYQPAAGDVTLLARVQALANCAPGRITFGVMVRASLTPTAPYVMAAVSGAPGAALQLRRYDGYLSNVARIDNGVTLPLWLRAVRRGDRAIAGYSKDGTSWKETELGVGLPPGAQIGLAASSHRISVPCDGLFEQVAVLPGSPDGGVERD